MAKGFLLVGLEWKQLGVKTYFCWEVGVSRELCVSYKMKKISNSAIGEGDFWVCLAKTDWYAW